MSKITTADFAKGMYIEFKGEPHQIVEFQHVNPGKGSAFVRTRVKSLKSGRVQEFTYKSGESVTQLEIFTREMQYLYKEGLPVGETSETYHFMDNRNYEQMSISGDVLGNLTHYLKDNEIYQVLVYKGQALGVRFPKKIRLKVVETEEAVKGNTVSGATKAAKLETGVNIQVPLFIKVDDLVSVDPETNTYVERVSG